jgi:hypothetical protein
VYGDEYEAYATILEVLLLVVDGFKACGLAADAVTKDVLFVFSFEVANDRKLFEIEAIEGNSGIFAVGLTGLANLEISDCL